MSGSGHSAGGITPRVIPEEHGGSGYGPAELAVVLEEMGRCLLVAPYFSTVVLGAQALVETQDVQAYAWTPPAGTHSVSLP